MKNKKIIILIGSLCVGSLFLVFNLKPARGASTCSSLGGHCVDGSVGCDVGMDLSPDNDECAANEQMCCKASTGTATDNQINSGSASFASTCQCLDASGNATSKSQDNLTSKSGCQSFCSGSPQFSFRYTNDGTNWFYDSNTTPGSSAAAGGGTTTTTFANPLKVDTLQGLLTNLLTNLQSVVAIIAIIMLIIGGIMYMFSGADEKMVETAKKTIGGAIIGIAIIFAAPAFLKELLAILDPKNAPTDSSGLLANALTLKQIAENVLNLLLSIVGILAIIGLIIGGGFYMTAYGDEDRIKKGKDIITASLIGILVASASLIIVRQIAALLSK